MRSRCVSVLPLRSCTLVIGVVSQHEGVINRLCLQKQGSFLGTTRTLNQESRCCLPFGLPCLPLLGALLLLLLPRTFFPAKGLMFLGIRRTERSDYLRYNSATIQDINLKDGLE